MGKLIDLTGQKFGHLTVVARDFSSTKNAKWICKCDCGKEVTKIGQGLRNGQSTCCDRKCIYYNKTAKKDLTNQKFGRLIALYQTSERKNGSVVWHCKCDCGNECNVSAASLTSGRTKSCGCLKKEKDKQPKGNTINLIGKKFNHLTVVKRNGSSKKGQAQWLCKCDCGNPNLICVLGSNLRSGHTQSCGCERMSHGEIAVSNLLKENNIPFEQEKVFFKFANGRNAKFDFYVNNSYIIEYDGETHFTANMHGWHTPERLKQQQERDAIKNQWCKDNGIPLIRIPYTQLKDLNIDDLRLETSNFII